MRAHGLAIISASSFARVVRLWAAIQIVMHVLWALTALLYFARGMSIAAWALPVFFLICLLGIPLYFGSLLYCGGAGDLLRSGRCAFLKLALAPPLSAAFFIFMFTHLRHSPGEVMQILQNTQSLEIFYKFAHPVANVAVNLCLWLAMPFVGNAARSDAKPLAA
jgi:hypothetical protein